MLRPLLAGNPVRVLGEPGAGKTALLAHVAFHERTRRRFRRVWWFDSPDLIDQTLALALNLLINTTSGPDQQPSGSRTNFLSQR